MGLRELFVNKVSLYSFESRIAKILCIFFYTFYASALACHRKMCTLSEETSFMEIIHIVVIFRHPLKGKISHYN